MKVKRKQVIEVAARPRSHFDLQIEEHKRGIRRHYIGLRKALERGYPEEAEKKLSELKLDEIAA